MDIQNKPPYMFSSPGIDYFFRWRWWAAWLAFIPVAAALSVLAILTTESYLEITLMFFAGFVVWTLFEYLMHRFAFHFVGNTPALEHLHYVVHGMHHVYPTDPLRVIFPPFASALLGAGIAGIFFLVLPLPWASSFTGGFILGYVVYEFMHYGAHHIKWKQSWFYKRKRHHLLHHHNDEFRNKNFGVTTAIWDRVFNTYRV